MSSAKETPHADKKDQNEFDHEATNQPTASTCGEKFKRPQIKSLNLKPSLSMTSLPPQSPKEPINDESNERPYNSLKKKRETNEQRELWRRSWESQNSVSTTTSHTGTSTGKNEFWATYNYLMDNSIIDSCKEASGETKFANDVTGDLNFKSINPNINCQQSNGSQGSNLVSDPRRLRRWLKDMESCISKLPSFKEAMKLSANELSKYSTESSDLYREINSNSRFVAACVRSLEKENFSTKNVDDQPKSLDYSEHDSLVSTITATSTESKRSENALKTNVLERRYHLLYLKAFEINCMFESLLEKRNLLLLNEEFQKNTIDTSDEEPIAKIPKFDVNAKFYSHKSQDESHLITDADFEDSEAEKEMECVALKGDCVDHAIIVPVTKAKSPPKTPLEKPSPKVTVVRRPKDFSKFNRSNRKSKNCAIFYYKHIDTDNDQIKPDGSKESDPTVSSSGEDEIWEYSSPNNNNNHHDGEEIIANEIVLEEKNENNADVTAKQEENENSPIKNNEKTADCPQLPQPTPTNASSNVKLMTLDSWRELALEAESIVRQKINDKTTKTEYFFNEIVGARNNQIGQQKKMTEKSQKESTKYTRVQEWLKRNQIHGEDVLNVQSIQLEDDGDASAECTSDTEESGSTSSEEITDSVATCLQGIDPMMTSTEGLENTSPIHKVAMRVKSTHRRNSERPWSVSCLSQLTRNSRQSLTDDKIIETATATLSNFSISESALNQLPKQYKNTSEADSKSNACNNLAPNSSVGSKNSSLRRRRVKLRKKSLSSNKRSDSGSSVKDINQVSALLKSMTKPDAFHTSLMEDLSVAISMMNIVKENNGTNQSQDKVIPAQKPESGDEQTMKRPNFKIGSITNVYGNPNAMSLGSLAALSNYNSAENRANETGTENLSGFSEHNMWDNYMGEKYNSEAYSEDRDVDAARKLLDCDDYRNFIDSQSDCCSSLNSAANQLDSMSPPRPRKNLDSSIPQPSSSNENSLNAALRQRRTHEDRKNNILLEQLLKKANEYDASFKKQQKEAAHNSSSKNLSNHNHNDEVDECKFIADCKLALEHTQALRQASANPQLLRPEDYDEIVRTCLKNIEQLESIIGADCENPTQIEELIASWNSLLNWSENAAKARRLQEEIILQKQLLDSIDIDNEWVLNSEEAIREKISELMNAREELSKNRSNMLKLNAAVHSWLTRQELELSRHQNEEFLSMDGEQATQSYDLSALADDELHKHLKDEIVSLYAKWDSINSHLSQRLESLKDSLICWTKFEKGLEELKENLSKDRGALNGLKGAIEEGTTTPEELVDNVQQVSKLLSEKLENRIQTISSNEDFMMHPEATLKFIASSNGSYQSDSGISDEGFSELSERERRLIALKKIAKQLESALSPSSDVLKTITQRMEAAENELKVLQSTCRELIFRTSSQLLKQQGIDISSHAQSQINVQIPIITIKNKSKRSLPRRGKKRTSPISNRKSADLKVETRSNDDLSDQSEMEGQKKTKWGFLKRVAKLAIPIQLTIITLFCVACLLEPRCCDTLNNLSMSLTPQLRYVKGPPPT